MQVTDKPRGSSISGLTHPSNPKIQVKFRFFADCLSLINIKAGEYYYFETETHISLLKVLQYSIETELHNVSSRFTQNIINQVKYVIKTHPLLNVKDRIISQYYSTTPPDLSSILTHTGNKKNNLEQIDTILKRHIQDVSVNYLDNLVKGIALCINCNHELNYHKKDLDYYARLVFSHFYLNGFSRSDISSIISKLLNNEVEQYDNKIHIDGILPSDLYKKLFIHNQSDAPFNVELFDEIKNYFKNRNMQQQIEGLIYRANYDKYDYTYIFKVDGVRISEKEVDLLGMRLINTESLRKKYEGSLKYDTVNDFLNQSSVLIEYKTKGYSDSEALSEALSEVKGKLDKIGFILGKHFRLNTVGYLVIIDENDLWVNYIHEPTSIRSGDLKAIVNRESTIKRQEFKEFILSKESILYDAHGEINLGKSLHDYSRFLEQLTKNNLSGIKPEGGVPDKVLAMAYLLLLCEENQFRTRMRRWAYFAIINSITIPIFGQERKVELEDFRNRKKIPSIAEMIKRFDHPHTKYRLKMAYDSRQNDSQVVAFHYYVRHLVMLIRYRNIQEHMSLSEKQYARKLKLSLDVLFARVINHLSVELNKPSNSNLSAEQILHNLILAGKAKADVLKIEL